jgi:phosphatidate cytidylyltransferase
MLFTRVVTAVVLLAILLPALFWAPHWVWQVVSLGLLVLAGLEWGRLMRGKGYAVPFALALLVACICLMSLNYWGLSSWVHWLSVAILFLASAYWLVMAPNLLSVRRSVQKQASVVAFILLMATWIAVTQLQVVSAWYVLSCLLIVWIADTGAYFAGRAFGKRKLAPSISPGKTWAGVYGGLLLVLLYFVALSQLESSFALGQSFPTMLASRWGLFPSMLIAVILTSLSVIGDLLESKLKREAGVKDSGTTLPGHGGVLDRIDAVVAVLPLCAMLHLASSWQR